MPAFPPTEADRLKPGATDLTAASPAQIDHAPTGHPFRGAVLRKQSATSSSNPRPTYTPAPAARPIGMSVDDVEGWDGGWGVGGGGGAEWHRAFVGGAGV